MGSTPSADRIARNVRRIQAEIVRSTEKNVRSIIARRVEEEAVEASSLSDHTLEDLAVMGHPYARRYPPDSGPHPDELIHHQTEGVRGARGISFIDSFTSEVVAIPGGSVTYRLRNRAPHWLYLKDGTSKMRARPLHQYLARQIRDEIAPEFQRAQALAWQRIGATLERSR